MTDTSVRQAIQKFLDKKKAKELAEEESYRLSRRYRPEIKKLLAADCETEEIVSVMAEGGVKIESFYVEQIRKEVQNSLNLLWFAKTFIFSVVLVAAITFLMEFR